MLKNLFLSIGHVFLEVGQALFFILKIVVVGILQIGSWCRTSPTKEDFPAAPDIMSSDMSNDLGIDNLSLDLKDRVPGNIWYTINPLLKGG